MSESQMSETGVEKFRVGEKIETPTWYNLSETEPPPTVEFEVIRIINEETVLLKVTRNERAESRRESWFPVSGTEVELTFSRKAQSGLTWAAYWSWSFPSNKVFEGIRYALGDKSPHPIDWWIFVVELDGSKNIQYYR